LLIFQWSLHQLTNLALVCWYSPNRESTTNIQNQWAQEHEITNTVDKGLTSTEKLVHFSAGLSIVLFLCQQITQLDNPSRMMQSVTKNSEGFGFLMARLILAYQFKSASNSL
jgi:hypothetical protein